MNEFTIEELRELYFASGNPLYVWQAIAITPLETSLEPWIRDYLLGCCHAAYAPGQPAWKIPGTLPLSEFEHTPEGRVRVPSDGPQPAEWEKPRHDGLLDLVHFRTKNFGAHLSPEQKAEKVAVALGIVVKGKNRFQSLASTYRSLVTYIRATLEARKIKKEAVIAQIAADYGVTTDRVKQILREGQRVRSILGRVPSSRRRWPEGT